MMVCGQLEIHLLANIARLQKDADDVSQTARRKKSAAKKNIIRTKPTITIDSRADAAIIRKAIRKGIRKAIASAARKVRRGGTLQKK